MPRLKQQLILVACLLQGVAVFAQNATVDNAQAVPPFDATDRLPDPSVSFFIIGDWGTASQAQHALASAMSRVFAEVGASAVLTTGDNFQNFGVGSVNDPQWKLKFEDAFPADALPLPFWATLGDHDYTGDAASEVQYTGRRVGGAVTRWHMPGREWSTTFTAPGGGFSVRIVGLDTHPLTGENAAERNAELGWIDSVLSSSRESCVIVIGHHSVFSNGIQGNTLSMIKHVKPILERHAIDLFIGGHDHDLQLLKPVQGIHYAVSGGGGMPRDTRWAANTVFAATNGGFIWLQVNATEMLIRFYDLQGTVRYSQRLKKNFRPSANDAAH